MKILSVTCEVENDGNICFFDACNAVIKALNGAKGKALYEDGIDTYGTIEDAEGNLLGDWSLDERRR